MDAIILSLQENPLYLGIVIGMGGLLLVSLMKQLIKMAFILAVCLGAMFFYVHSQAPEQSGLDKIREALKDTVPTDLGERIRETSKEAAATLAEKSQDVAEDLADRIADAANEGARAELEEVADKAKDSLKAGAEKAEDKVRDITETVRKKLEDE